jgi:hypothetical protein
MSLGVEVESVICSSVQGRRVNGYGNWLVERCSSVYRRGVKTFIFHSVNRIPQVNIQVILSVVLVVVTDAP